MSRRCWRLSRMETWRTGSRCKNTHKRRPIGCIDMQLVCIRSIDCLASSSVRCLGFICFLCFHFYLPGTQQDGSSGLRPGEIPAVSDFQQPAEHAPVSGHAGRSIAHIVQFNRAGTALRLHQRRHEQWARYKADNNEVFFVMIKPHAIGLSKRS